MAWLWRVLRWLPLLAALLLAALPHAVHASDPHQGPGGPILVVTSPAAPFRHYYAEILRSEGLNAFAVSDIADVSPAGLAAYDVVLLAKMPLTPTQVTMFADWVGSGGTLIAMAPDAQLAPLLGLVPAGGTLSDAYLRVDTTSGAGNGIVGQTIQFHGSADLYTLDGASAIATLYGSAAAATAHPAVSVRAVGSGHAAAFAYDLATSIVQTRQGNPAWATQERDGFAPIRSDDKFYGAADGDVQPDWVDLTKVSIPQADEQQRLLANLILVLNATRKPLPRFWYFPFGKKAVVVMTGDDHGNNGTAGRFEQFLAASPAGCSVANWECVRGTSYLYPTTPLADADAAAYAAQGFEIGLHLNTGCADFTPASLEEDYASQLADWAAAFPSLPAPRTQRHHCIAWSDWSSAADVQLNHGMRLDTSYYYWPPSWVGNAPGLFTGSAMPMRFSRLDGTLHDVYQATTQMTDESGQAYPFTVSTLLDRALGAEGYYGAYVINAHTDVAEEIESSATVAAAQARGVPIVSSAQMLTWLDGRNGSSFGAIGWNGATLSFTVTQAPGAHGLQAMLPAQGGPGVLSALTRGGNPVPFTVRGVKGIQYAMFDAAPGSYAATYALDTTAPVAGALSPAAGATQVGVDTAVSVAFDEAIDPASIGAATFALRDAQNALVAAAVSYDPTSRTVMLQPSGLLAGNALHTATLRGGAAGVRDLAGNALAADVVWSFTTGAGTVCPCGAWPATTVPLQPSVADPAAVELGVKFTVDIPGYVSGVRFYKGSGNTGTHVGNLWTLNGQLLASATFVNETATGWQQVDFPNPVAVERDTVYVASYFAPNGGYAAEGSFFTAAGIDRPPVHLLRDGIAGGNGVYAYNPTSTFPSLSYQASNYWVDIAFTTTAPPDTIAPTVTSVTPIAGASGVSPGHTVSAVFNEPLDPSTVDATTAMLLGPGNVPVAATVSYDAASRAVALVPGEALAAQAAYTAVLRGGASGARIQDLAGNALAADHTWSFTTGVAGGSCAAPPNAIVAENCLAGSPASEWDVSGAGSASIQGYATDISVNRGGTIGFKVDTSASAYRFDIYRMGYYGGLGARKVATVLPSAALPQSQPECLTDPATGLVDCGNWALSGTWDVPANATSGIYFARLVRSDNGGASHVFFVVRDDASTSDLLFQTSDTTWQAYNTYGGNSLYTGSPAGRAYKVSYNRPFITRSVDGGQDWVFYSEYPMVRWLEANGYDVSYASGVDTDRSGSRLLNHRTFLSVGHDEYWSAAQRSHVEAARNAGVNLAFFSGNEVFWKTRWEDSIDGSGTPYRTLVCYKETHANAKIDPLAGTWTGTWRDPRFSPPADGGRPENALTGTIFMVNAGATTAIQVPAADGKMRLWRNTSVAALADNTTATLAANTLGYEWDADLDNGARPPGLVRMSTTEQTNSSILLDYGSTYGFGSVNHALTLYRHASGARVFGAGTIQWSWGLDNRHDTGALAAPAADVRMQQATVNLLADMGAQPGTLQPALLAASASTDTTAASSQITAPAPGATLQRGVTTTIGGTATDTGGGVVGGVEVSVDGGATWRRANGRGSWSFAWTPTVSGSITLRSRAVDDSGNLEAPSAGVTVEVGSGNQSCPCTIFAPNSVPGIPSDPDTASVNLGVKFRSDLDGTITGVRFYKGAANTGTHIGTLWSSAGLPLASVTFTNETASGWQQASFATPVAITANTVYVVSYLAPNGRYAGDTGAFLASGVDNAPLHALRDGESGGNGVFTYAPSTTFPTSTFGSSNYWVDVVFVPQPAGDTTPPTITAQTPAPGATGVDRATAVTVTFSEAMDPATIGAGTIELRNPAGTLIAATVSYDAATRVATLVPTTRLGGGKTFTATVRGGGTDPRVKDLAGNALAASASWSFTTTNADTTAPTITARSPLAGATGVSRSTTVTVTFSEAMDPATITTGTIRLTNPSGTVLAAAVGYDAATRTATLTPSSRLAASKKFTVTVRGGATEPTVKDLAGNALAKTATWKFTTGATSAAAAGGP